MKFDLSKKALDGLKANSYTLKALRAQITIINAAHYAKTGRIDEAIAEILAEMERMDNEKDQEQSKRD